MSSDDGPPEPERKRRPAHRPGHPRPRNAQRSDGPAAPSLRRPVPGQAEVRQTASAPPADESGARGPPRAKDPGGTSGPCQRGRRRPRRRGAGMRLARLLCRPAAGRGPSSRPPPRAAAPPASGRPRHYRLAGERRAQRHRRARRDRRPGGQRPHPRSGGGDRICAGPGDDLVWGESGADPLDGGGGADVLRGGGGRDLLWGGAGDDHLFGGANPTPLAAGRAPTRATPRTKTGCEDAIVADHRAVDLSRIPDRWRERAAETVVWAYGSTSHGTQVWTGAEYLEALLGSVAYPFQRDWRDVPGQTSPERLRMAYDRAGPGMPPPSTTPPPPCSPTPPPPTPSCGRGAGNSPGTPPPSTPTSTP